MSYLKVTDLAIGYEGTSVAEHISFEVKQGEYLFIVGENGAGKSTLVKTLLHLQKPMSGQIAYGENGVGYLPQQTNIQRDFPASVWEIVLSGNLLKCGFRPFYSHKEKENARANMERMGIWELRKQCYRNLSGGQQQRVLLARALCASSNMLFLDEPVSGLDPKVTAELYQLLDDMNKEGMTIITVSHDIHAALQYASHILHVEKDKSFFGTVEQYKHSDISEGFGTLASTEPQNIRKEGQ